MLAWKRDSVDRLNWQARGRMLADGRLTGPALRFDDVLAYQTGGETSTGALPADPTKRWRCMFVDEVDQVIVAEPASPWGTADNYNASHPFNTIDELTIAINSSDPGSLAARFNEASDSRSA